MPSAVRPSLSHSQCRFGKSTLKALLPKVAIVANQRLQICNTIQPKRRPLSDLRLGPNVCSKMRIRFSGRSRQLRGLPRLAFRSVSSLKRGPNGPWPENANYFRVQSCSFSLYLLFGAIILYNWPAVMVKIHNRTSGLAVPDTWRVSWPPCRSCCGPSCRRSRRRSRQSPRWPTTLRVLCRTLSVILASFPCSDSMSVRAK